VCERERESVFVCVCVSGCLRYGLVWQARLTDEPLHTCKCKIAAIYSTSTHSHAITHHVQLVGEYRSWVDAQLKASDVASVAVLYASAYGNTSALAQVCVVCVCVCVCVCLEASAANPAMSGLLLSMQTLGIVWNASRAGL